MPIVLLDRRLSGCDDLDSVLVDSEGGAAQAAEHLLRLGHRRIGLVDGPLDTTPGRARHEGFVTALSTAGVELDPLLIQMGDFKDESGYQATLRLLGLPMPVTAIFSANNLMSIGVLRALDHMGVRVPEELSFVGFDDLDLAEMLSPPLSVISRPAVEQGVLAMRLLRNRIEGNGPPKAQHIVLDTTLTVRGSSGPPQRSPDGLADISTSPAYPSRGTDKQ